MFDSPARHRNPAYKPLFAWFFLGALLWTICLLYAGGFTTSIRAGMAFLDWPLSNGSVNPAGWLTEADMRAEHSHRLLGALVGILTLTSATWLALREERRWLRRAALAAAVLVVVQGLLGGLRVKLDQLNTGSEHNLVAQTFAVAHACTAQVFLCVLVAIAVGSSRRWTERMGGLQRRPSASLQHAGLAACAAVFVQLLLGAVMRHTNSGLAIPTFPFTPDGGLWPQAWDAHIAIHFAHRAWAVVVALALLRFAGRLWAARHVGRILGVGSLALMLLLAMQIYLGALVVWTARNAQAATVHMLTGAFLLATTWGLTFLCRRFDFAERPPNAPVLAPTEQPAPHAAGV